jgi:hypothetical protein
MQLKQTQAAFILAGAVMHLEQTASSFLVRQRAARARAHGKDTGLYCFHMSTSPDRLGAYIPFLLTSPAHDA